MKKAAVSDVAEKIKEIVRNRRTIDELTAFNKKNQPLVIAEMKSVDPDNAGIVIDPEDSSKGAAYVQQNNASELWDREAIISWLKRRPSRWKACSTEVFDTAKWEAEVAAGNIPTSVARRMKISGDAPAPYIRPGKLGPDNLES